ncbi:MAG: hypothetical protein HGB33_09760, partial [Syntrophaceae bacterium]|nr:hypothetical protein [Syntrophaceae bacterium]
YIYGWARRLSSPKKSKMVPVTASEHKAINPNRCILVGYGPIGKIVHRLLLDRGAEITVIDLNLNTIRRLRAEGYNAIYGDVLRPGTLEDAGIATAGSLILSTDIEDAAEIIKQARLLNPDIKIMVRCAHLREAAALRRAGATVVAAGEAEVGVALSEVVTAGDQMVCVTAAEHRESIRRMLYDAPEGRKQ